MKGLIDKNESYFAVYRNLTRFGGKSYGGTDLAIKNLILSEIISRRQMPLPRTPTVAGLSATLNLTRKTVSKHIREILYGWDFVRCRLERIFVQSFVEDLKERFEKYVSRADRARERGAKKLPKRMKRSHVPPRTPEESLTACVELTGSDEDSLPVGLKRPYAHIDKKTDYRQSYENSSCLSSHLLVENGKTEADATRREADGIAAEQRQPCCEGIWPATEDGSENFNPNSDRRQAEDDTDRDAGPRRFDERYDTPEAAEASVARAGTPTNDSTTASSSRSAALTEAVADCRLVSHTLQGDGI